MVEELALVVNFDRQDFRSGSSREKRVVLLQLRFEALDAVDCHLLEHLRVQSIDGVCLLPTDVVVCSPYKALGKLGLFL